MWDEHGFYKALELRSDLAGLVLQVPRQSFVSSCRQVLEEVEYIGLPVSFCQNNMLFDKLLVVIDLDGIVRYLDPDLFTCVLVRDGIAFFFTWM
jgi:hypothetical protein